MSRAGVDPEASLPSGGGRDTAGEGDITLRRRSGGRCAERRVRGGAGPQSTPPRAPTVFDRVAAAAAATLRWRAVRHAPLTCWRRGHPSSPIVPRVRTRARRPRTTNRPRGAHLGGKPGGCRRAAAAPSLPVVTGGLRPIVCAGRRELGGCRSGVDRRRLGQPRHPFPRCGRRHSRREAASRSARVATARSAPRAAAVDCTAVAVGCGSTQDPRGWPRRAPSWCTSTVARTASWAGHVEAGQARPGDAIVTCPHPNWWLASERCTTTGRTARRPSKNLKLLVDARGSHCQDPSCV